MSPTAFLLVLAVGALIGAVGIGGFLLVPVLVFLEGRPLREAVIAATVSFAGSGLVSLLVSLRQGTLVSPGSRAFLAATPAGALAGALLLRMISGTTIALLIAFAVGLAGVADLFGLPRARLRSTGALRAMMNGLVTGIGSALTGTSGPLIGMPLLAGSGVPIVERIRIAQVAQLPIAATAAAVFLAAGDIRWTAAAVSALALALGAILGMRLATALAPVVLRRASALLMLATALGMLASAFLS